MILYHNICAVVGLEVTSKPLPKHQRPEFYLRSDSKRDLKRSTSASTCCRWRTTKKSKQWEFVRNSTESTWVLVRTDGWGMRNVSWLIFWSPNPCTDSGSRFLVPRLFHLDNLVMCLMFLSLCRPMTSNSAAQKRASWNAVFKQRRWLHALLLAEIWEKSHTSSRHLWNFCVSLPRQDATMWCRFHFVEWKFKFGVREAESWRRDYIVVSVTTD